MPIQNYTVPLSTPEPNFEHSYYSSAIRIFILPKFHIQTLNPKPIFYSLFYALSSPTPSSKFSLSKFSGCTIRYTHYFLEQSTMKLISRSFHASLNPHTSIPYIIFASHTISYKLPSICTFTLRVTDMHLSVCITALYLSVLASFFFLYYNLLCFPTSLLEN